MTPAEFKLKWGRYRGKESAAYQEHFNDLCRLLGQKTPAEADPSGSDFFCFQKRVAKDAELLVLNDAGEDAAPEERGFADVWKAGCFGWEYKGKRKNLDEAYRQLLRYREALRNPPLLVVCDFDRFVIRTNFNGTVQETHEFATDQIDRPEILRLLRAVFEDPEFLRPQRTSAQITEHLADRIAAVARSLQRRESVELADARTRAEANFALRKNLRIARFVNRIVFCCFAEDTGLLPKSVFSDLLKIGPEDLPHFARSLESLFAAMAVGGTFGKEKIRHFNGHLFEDATVFELNEEELTTLAEAAEADWRDIQPSIMGTLFERALEPEQRSQLGAHYTSEADIKTLVEPVLMAPWRREWEALRAELAGAAKAGRASAAQAEKLKAFQRRLSEVVVLDPACGSGNFLYVALQLLLGLEKEVVTLGTQLGLRLLPRVEVGQLRALEINPYAFELAQVSVQIGFLQWRRDNGFDNDRSPVLQNLGGFRNEDALLVPHYRQKPKSLKEAQAEEHRADDSLKFYTERDWPKCDVIVGNPPFIGNKRLRAELGDTYSQAVFETFGDRLPATSDFCCYWFEKARKAVETGQAHRAGLLATTASKQVSSRRAFERIRESGRIFFAISDRDWFDAGAAIRICMVGFADPECPDPATLDGKPVPEIFADLTAGTDTTGKAYLRENDHRCFMGTTKVGDFDLPFSTAREMLADANPHGRPNSDVLRPFVNGKAIVRESTDRWVVDFGVGTHQETASLFAAPFRHVVELVKPTRETNARKVRAQNWWLLGETLPAFRRSIRNLARYIGTARVAKHRLFVWLDSVVLPDSKVIAIAFDDDYRFGVLHSRFHEVWTLATCGWHGKGNDATYNPTECFETFPFPRPTPAHEAAIADAAKALNELRDRWLHPPEWTVERIWEFPGSVGGPWHHYIEAAGPDGVGLVRFPRIEPRDEACAAKLKRRTLTNLYNERPAWLDLAHRKLDAAVAEAYGWPADLSDDEIVERLLALNLDRAAYEAATKPAKPRTSRPKRDDEML